MGVSSFNLCIFMFLCCVVVMMHMKRKDSLINSGCYFCVLVLYETNLWILCCSEFCSVVRKIFIYTAEEVKKLSQKIGLPLNENRTFSTEEQSSTVGPSC